MKRMRFSSHKQHVVQISLMFLCCIILIRGTANCVYGKTINENKVKLNKQVVHLIPKDDYRLKVIGYEGKISYKSRDPKIATVTKNGKIVAKKIGQTNIIVTVKGKKYSCKVKVNKYGISDSQVTLTLGDTICLDVYGINGKKTFTSTNTKVITVTKKGRVKTKGVGQARIIVSVKGKKYKSEITVKKPKVLSKKYGESERMILYSDGFMFRMKEEDLGIEQYKVYNIAIGYQEDVSDAIPINIKKATIYGKRKGSLYSPIHLNVYKQGLNEMFQEFLASYDLMKQMKHSDLSKHPVQGFVFFRERSRVQKIKYKDGIHSFIL